jgi:hypothetical protein
VRARPRVDADLASTDQVRGDSKPFRVLQAQTLRDSAADKSERLPHAWRSNAARPSSMRLTATVSQLWNSTPSTVPLTFTRPRVPKYSADPGISARQTRHVGRFIYARRSTLSPVRLQPGDEFFGSSESR